MGWGVVEGLPTIFNVIINIVVGEKNTMEQNETSNKQK